ncbi:MAG: GNAT family N-acetyltransferase [Thaumarchaeota archaeon]|nr:GNAT family N-acetyltransferase [Nitrososphaerota archaeon]
MVPLDPLAHGDSLFELMGGRENEALWFYLSKGPFPDRESFDKHLKQVAASDDPLCFAAIDERSGRALGWAAFMHIEPAHRVVEVGNVVFSRALQHTTGGTEAIYLMARHAFEDLGYRRLEWKCNTLNAPSRKAAMRFGFKFEGVFRNHMILKGRSRDSAWFSIIDSEWPERRSAFEAWLDPSNFDSEGRQRTSLSALNHVET